MNTNRRLSLKQTEQRLGTLRPLLGSTSMRGGWIRYIRHAMYMTLGNLAKAARISLPTVQQMEKRESEGKITIESMKKIANAMNCEFVYAIIPRETLPEALKKQALSRATQIVKQADLHMTLEDQKVSEDINHRIERLAEELLEKGKIW